MIYFLTRLDWRIDDDLSTYANVYISYDNQSWTYIGNISYESTAIDLTEFNYQSHANYLRLDFEGNNHNSFMNLSSVRLGSYKRYCQLICSNNRHIG